MNTWNRDWLRFCEEIVSDINEGLDDAALSKKYGESTVRWSGTVKELDIESQSLPSVSITMDARTKYIAKGCKFICDSVTLFIDDAAKGSWFSADVGELVEFEAVIYEKNGLFNGVKVSTFPGDDSAILLLGLHHAKRVA